MPAGVRDMTTQRGLAGGDERCTAAHAVATGAFNQFVHGTPAARDAGRGLQILSARDPLSHLAGFLPCPPRSRFEHGGFGRDTFAAYQFSCQYMESKNQ